MNLDIPYFWTTQFHIPGDISHQMSRSTPCSLGDFDSVSGEKQSPRVSAPAGRPQCAAWTTTEPQVALIGHVPWKNPKVAWVSTKWPPPDIAKLVTMTPITMVRDGDDYSAHGFIKQQPSLGGGHIVRRWLILKEKNLILETVLTTS